MKTLLLYLVTAIAEIVGCYLPLLWLRTGQRPSALSWGGAALAVCGLALIFSR